MNRVKKHDRINNILYKQPVQYVNMFHSRPYKKGK
jgi:hypothetical protein